MDIRKANCQHKFTGVIFFNLIGAFDNVISEALFILLTKYGIPYKIFVFIKTTITYRNLIGFVADIALQRRFNNLS